MGFVPVSSENPCTICKKPDWCMRTKDGRLALCARVESSKPCGRAGAGWLHVIGDNQPSSNSLRRWRSTGTTSKRSPVEIQTIARKHCENATVGLLTRLADSLGVTVDSLTTLRTGYNVEKYCYSFPMRDAAGRICGIRYRSLRGDKWSERGSNQGLFFRPELLADHLVIVEGPTDTAALLSVGIQSVIGRASCSCNVDQIKTICSGHRFRSVVIIPDNDSPGMLGANRLAEAIKTVGISSELLSLPAGTKDCRQCIQSKTNADWLADQIGKLFFQSSHGANKQ